MNIEIIRNTLYKAYLEDFYQFCESIGGPTAEVMGDILRVSKTFFYTADNRISNFNLDIHHSLKQIVVLSTLLSILSVLSYPRKIVRSYSLPLVAYIQKEMHV